MNTELTDAECDAFRALPLDFNGMVRAIYAAGAARSADTSGALKAEIISLLWDLHPECCGCPCVGAVYMGQREMICCGEPEYDLLTDAQIVVSLRALFPEPPPAAPGGPAGALRPDEQGPPHESI